MVSYSEVVFFAAFAFLLRVLCGPKRLIFGAVDQKPVTAKVAEGLRNARKEAENTGGS